MKKRCAPHGKEASSFRLQLDCPTISLLLFEAGQRTILPLLLLSTHLIRGRARDSTKLWRAHLTRSIRNSSSCLGALLVVRLAVARHLVRSTETLATFLTAERLLSTVDSSVLGQIARLGERFATPRELALERLCTRVDALMDRQRAGNAERLSTSWIVAHIRLLVSVRAHVLCQGVGLAEAAAADLTLVRSIACMRLNVAKHLLLLAKLLALCKAFAADPAALVRGLARSHVDIRNVLRKTFVIWKHFSASLPTAVMSLATIMADLDIVAAEVTLVALHRH